MKFPKRGAYTGRLAFDPDSEFHVSSDGRKVVTLDGGRTWRYAKRGDLSHNARHSQATVPVDSTDNERLRLIAKHGPTVADAEMWREHPHHFEVQVGDPHFDQGADNKTQLRHAPDSVAATVTSHTDSWKEEA